MSVMSNSRPELVRCDCCLDAGAKGAGLSRVNQACRAVKHGKWLNPTFQVTTHDCARSHLLIWNDETVGKRVHIIR